MQICLKEAEAKRGWPLTHSEKMDFDQEVDAVIEKYRKESEDGSFSYTLGIQISNRSQDGTQVF